MAATPVTPQRGLTLQVQYGSQAVVVSNGGDNGGIIQNPLAAADQGLVTAEVLYVDVVGQCAPTNGTIQANGTIFALQPGQNWYLVAGQTTSTWVNAVSSGHQFSVVRW